jgi:hypothetical protein
MTIANPGRTTPFADEEDAELRPGAIRCTDVERERTSRDGLTALDQPWHTWMVAHRSTALTELPRTAEATPFRRREHRDEAWIGSCTEDFFGAGSV